MAPCIRILFLACAAVLGGAAGSESHPLDPLSKEEIDTAVEALRASHRTSEASRFVIVALHEPPKPAVLAAAAGREPPRQAFVIVYERAANATFEAVVDLETRRVLQWRAVPGVQPPILGEEYEMTADILKADPGWRAALRRRGIADVDSVHVDPWPVGDQARWGGSRVVAAVSYYRGASSNPYARPIDGLVAYVDLNRKQVRRLLDSGVVPVPPAGAGLSESAQTPRAPPRRLEIRQPDGPSFTLEGTLVRWQNWDFRFGLHPREGLVLHTVGYEDRGRRRPILYRASVSEVLVTYPDIEAAWVARNAFDEGEYDLGRWANSLEPGTDAPAGVTFIDAIVANDAGEAKSIPRALALYERDGGLLWKHADYPESNESRRARQLVLSWIANQGNYEYGFNWVFHQDGTLEMEVLLAGVVLPRAVAASDRARYRHGNRMTRQIEAVHHQHWLNFRLDLDVEGPRNSLVEIEGVPARAGRGGGGFEARETPLRREGGRRLNPESSRTWKVINPGARNELGQPVGYELVPGENAVPLAAASSSALRRAGFTRAHVWVTPVERAERYAAGDYPNQNPSADGLPRWTKAGRPVEDRDIVLWYTMGITHLPRREEWPVMSVHRAGFRLVPNGFFDRNPGLDVPRPPGGSAEPG